MEQKTSSKLETPQPEGDVAHGRDSGRYRRKRTVFSIDQLERLESIFESEKYPGVSVREALASELGISESCVQVWFQNRRSRWRKRHNNKQPSSVLDAISTKGFETGLSRTHISAERIWPPLLVQNHGELHFGRYPVLSAAVPAGSSFPATCASSFPTHAQLQDMGKDHFMVQMPPYGAEWGSEFFLARQMSCNAKEYRNNECAGKIESSGEELKMKEERSLDEMVGANVLLIMSGNSESSAFHPITRSY